MTTVPRASSFARQFTTAFTALDWLFLALILPIILLISPGWSPVLLFFPFLWVVRKAATGHFVVQTPLNTSIALLLLMVLVSLYATYDLAFSLPKVAGILFGVAIFYSVAATTGRSVSHLWMGVVALLAMGTAVALVGLLTLSPSAKLPILEPVNSFLAGFLNSSSLAGTISNNEIAGVLLWSTPLAGVVAGAMFWRRPSFVRQWWSWPFYCMTVLLVLANALLLSGTLLLTQSRGGLLGFGASFLFILLVVLRRHRGIVLTLILLAVMGAIALAFDERMAEAALAVLGGSSDTGSLGGSSLAGRWEIWTRAVYGIQDFPFTGMGVGTFRNIVNLRYPLSLLNQNTDIAHAHNHLLQTGLDLGIPGLVAYIALWLGCAAMLWRSWRYSSSFWLRLLAVGLGANLVAYGVYGMVDAVALGARPGFIFWLLLGLIAGLYRNVERSRQMIEVSII